MHWQIGDLVKLRPGLTYPGLEIDKIYQVVAVEKPLPTLVQKDYGVELWLNDGNSLSVNDSYLIKQNVM